MPARAVFDFDDPEVRVCFALVGEGLVNVGLWPLSQNSPMAGVCHQIKAAVIGAGLSVKRVELNEDNTCRVIAMFNNKRRDVL